MATDDESVQATHRFGIAQDIDRARARLDDLVQLGVGARELAITRTKLEEASMWFAKCCELRRGFAVTCSRCTFVFRVLDQPAPGTSFLCPACARA